MKPIFYFLYGAFGLLGVYFVITSLLGHFVIDSLPQSISKLLLVVAAAVGAWLFYRAYLIGEVQQRYAAGSGAVIMAILLFLLIPVAGMFVGGLLRKLTH